MLNGDGFVRCAPYQPETPLSLILQPPTTHLPSTPVKCPCVPASEPERPGGAPPTVAAGQRAVPLVALLADQRLVIAERVAGVAAEGHCGPDSEAAALPPPVHGDPWIEAGV